MIDNSGYPTSEEGPGLWQLDCSRAIKADLRYRAGDVTAKDRLAYWNSRPEARRAQPRARLAPEREREVLAAWKTKGRQGRISPDVPVKVPWRCSG